jgi:hypothetical protein
MTYTALVKLQYNSKWESTGGIYDDEMLPEENITFEVPAEDLNTVQLFGLFNKFLYAMGHTESGIMKGAMSTTFNDMRSFEQMKKTADEYDLVMKEDHIKEICELEAEIRDLKAKLSRALDPENPNYTDDEIEAMTEEIIAEASKPSAQTLKDAEYNSWQGLVPGSPEAYDNGCKCPILDNQEMPQNRKWVNADCPIHGKVK